MWEPLVFGDFIISWYNLTYTIAVLLAIIVVFVDIDRYHLPKKEILPTLFWGVPFALFGGQLFFLIFFTDKGITTNFVSDIFSTGSMYYGVEIFGLTAAMLYVKKIKLNVWGSLDLAALFFFVAHGVGRIGCYAGGCCYGTPTDSFLGVVFPFLGYPVHPTQLYETAFLLIGFTIVWFIRKKIDIHGLIYCIYVMFYSVARFSIEFIRDDASQMGFGILNISPSQYIAIIMFFFASGLMTYLIRKNQKEKSLAAA